MHTPYTGMSLHEMMWIECLDTHIFLTSHSLQQIFFRFEHANYSLYTQLATLYILAWSRSHLVCQN